MPTTLQTAFLLVFCCTLAAAETPAELRVAAAHRVIQAKPKSAQAYNDLAIALTRRTRETGDLRFLSQAELALQQAMQLQPGNYDSQKIRIAVLLARHQYPQALTAAKDLNHRVPDDIPVWGLLADANFAVGNYTDAEKDVQWMLDLRPGNAPAFIEGAKLREVYGDLEGALDFMSEALRRASENETEDQAWLMTESGRLQWLSGNSKTAAETLQRALEVFPAYHLALRTLAQVRTAEGRYAEALPLFASRRQAVGDAASDYEWAEALEHAGRGPEAAAAFAAFEQRAAAETSNPYNANRDLILLYADHRNEPAKALALAEREHALRHDAATQDAYAWALFRSHKPAQAKTELDQVLALGIREPVFFCHASRIAGALGDQAAASKFLEQASVASATACPAEKPALTSEFRR